MVMIQVKERTFDEVRTKVDSLRTDLTKMEYLESVSKMPDMPIDVKKFLFSNLVELYERKLMFDKAAKAMFLKAGYDVTYREKVESYLRSAEYYAKGNNLISAEDMFLRALREGNSEQRAKVELTRKNIYLSLAADLERKGRAVYAAKFYEHLLTLKLDDLEKESVKAKLKIYYTRFGKFNELKMLEHK